jgi:hypothetical protein
MPNPVAMTKAVMSRDGKPRFQRSPSTRLAKNMMIGTAGIIYFSEWPSKPPLKMSERKA